ncbi:tRNA (adenosine(37)-N6)-dimethylallyltransferase MiaA [Kurthia sibirica]|uniref:tRNA dimethylallyltransferase n=1 Tax=Kurthia sibirica TaxID=202750 RepID=A0A2U3AR23_9BACL|nr:tRNA (adenosine(37)-N6)-dimethylallyltransferase MiaA [Kurthia sibirica]PWI26974.1 tRNA (adenosine(37)-N6)-dimethylallyltransferase MiaA [Kurthia sibirica]GEK32476.1 tRNA dimethylallyltransferase [Kurthia sibirica]
MTEQQQQYDVLAIVGPTAVGKTALSIQLAQKLNGEIINGDSMQVYKDLNIGTAKITVEEMAGVPHHLIDVKEAHESFSVAEFQQLVREKIADIQSRGKLPIIVGGTGLYIQAVLYDFRFTEEKIDTAVREAYYEQLEQVGPEAMHAKLMAVDPETAAIIHPNNTRRVLRALEMAEHGEVMKSSEEAQQGNRPLYNHYIIGLNRERAQLYERINLRVNNMLEKGLLEEVTALHEAGLRDCQSMSAIGYKELYAYLEDRYTLEDAVEKLKQNSRRYAKRQLTYFKNKLDVTWFDVTEENNMLLCTILGKIRV